MSVATARADEAKASTTAAGGGSPVTKVDLLTRRFESQPPHDASFSLDVRLPKSIVLRTVEWMETTQPTSPPYEAAFVPHGKARPFEIPDEKDKNRYDAHMPALRGNRHYVFRFTLANKQELRKVLAAALAVKCPSAGAPVSPADVPLCNAYGAYKVASRAGATPDIPNLQVVYAGFLNKIGANTAEFEFVRLYHEAAAEDPGVAQKRKNAEQLVERLSTQNERTRLSNGVQQGGKGGGLPGLLAAEVPEPEAIDAIEAQYKAQYKALLMLREMLKGMSTLPTTNIGNLDQMIADLQKLRAGLRGLHKLVVDLDKEATRVVEAEAARTDEVLSYFAATDTYYNKRITGDVGLMYSWTLETASPYLGVNWDLSLANYGLPLGKQASYRNWTGWLRRTSMVVGVLMRKVDDGERNTRSDLIDGNSLLTGAAFRFTQATRLSAGLVHFRQERKNPLRDDVRWGRAWYAALSYDTEPDLSKVKADNILQWIGAAGAIITRFSR
jgi:hypothetical protein